MENMKYFAASIGKTRAAFKETQFSASCRTIVARVFNTIRRSGITDVVAALTVQSVFRKRGAVPACQASNDVMRCVR